MQAGLSILEDSPHSNRELETLKNLGHFLENCIKTGINAKHWHLITSKLKQADEVSAALALCRDAEILIAEERANVEDTIPIVRADSHLGWEPCMGYCCAEEQLYWKLRQLDYLLHVELRAYYAALGTMEPYEWLFYAQL
ncbi:MAG: hypothetical protein FWF86_08980 [Clostridia bacterium]|nr:hypothetical protein [Clostridia bacterium]